MKKFTYLFCVGNKVVWSGEDEIQLAKRLKKELPGVQLDVSRFILRAKAGDYIELATGEMIFCTSGDCAALSAAIQTLESVRCHTIREDERREQAIKLLKQL